jgi:YVTN family beta-propeller protein
MVSENRSRIIAVPQGSESALSLFLYNPLPFQLLHLTLSILPNNYLTYFNSILGIQIRYPDDWLKNETSIGDRIASFDSQDYVAQVHVLLNNFPPSLNLNESLKNTIKQYQNDTNFRIINSNTNSTLAGQPAYGLVFTARYPAGGEIKQIITGTIVGSELYWIHVMVKAYEFSNYLPIVQKMINSFHILNITKVGGEKQQHQPLSYHYVAINDTEDIGSNASSTGWIYPVFTPAFGTNVTLNGAFKTSNGKPINVTLADSAKCGRTDRSGFVDFATCEITETVPQLRQSGSNIQTALLPERLYNIKFEDKVSNINRIKMNFVVNYRSDFIDYTNYTHLGVRMLYPYDWEKVQEDNGVKFFSPVQNGFQQNVFIDSQDIVTQVNKTLDQFIKSAINNYKQVKTDFKLIHSNKTILDGSGADRIVFTYTDGHYTFETTQIFMIKNNKIYRITYTAMPEKYSSYLPTIQKMIDSFRSVDLLTYKNPFIGISNLPYPSDWRRTENQSLVSFAPPLEDNNNTDSVLRVSRVPTSGNTLDKLINNDINSLKNNSTGFHLIDLVAVNYVGYPGYNLTYIYKDPTFEKQYKVTVFYTIAGNASYQILYAEQPERYNTYLDVMQQILASLKIQKTTNSTQLDEPALKLANAPDDLTVNPITSTLYVANAGSNTISIIDTKTNRIITNVSTLSVPDAVYFSKTLNNLYVANIGSNTISSLDTITKKVISYTKVGSYPNFIDASESGKWIFVSNRESQSVSVIDSDNNQVVSNIKVGSLPFGIAVNPITSTLYVANAGSNTVSVISYFQRIISFKISAMTSIEVGNSPNGVAVNPKTNTVYVSNLDDGTISVIDGSLNRVSKILHVGAGPFSLAVNPNTNTVYVTNSDDNTISVINGKTNKVIKTITVGYSPYAIAVNPNTNTVYVTNANTNEMYIINGTTNSITAGVAFEMGSGNINCNGRNVSNNDYIVYDINTVVKCKANPNRGFVFSSWSGDLPYNTDTTKPDAIQFIITRYGTLTANFNENPSTPTVALSPEFYNTVLLPILTGVILAPLAGWLIPYLADRSEKKRQLKYLGTYIPLIDGIYENHYKNKEECLQLLNQKRKDITALLRDGIVNDSSYGILDSRISEYTNEIGPADELSKEKKEGSPF